MKRYAFSVPIADATAALMKRADDKSIMKPEDIAGKIVGGQKGTSQVEQLKAFAAKLPKPVEVKEYVDNNQSYADLAAGRIDAAVNSLPNLAYAASQRSDAFALVTPAFGQPTYFSVGRPARRQAAHGRDQRRDPQSRGGRNDGEDPEAMVRHDHGSAEDSPRADDLRSELVPRPEERCTASRVAGRVGGMRAGAVGDRPEAA